MFYICFKVGELVKKKGTPITFFDFPFQKGLHTIFFESHKNVMSQFNTPVSITLDKLYRSAVYLPQQRIPVRAGTVYARYIDKTSSPKIKNCNATYKLI